MLKIFMVIFALPYLVSCGDTSPERIIDPVSIVTSETNLPYEASYETGNFVELSKDNIPDKSREFVDTVSKTAGIHKKDELFVIALGERPTGGYRILFDHQEVMESEIKLYFKLKEPGKGDIVTHSVTYPYVVGNMKPPIGFKINAYNVDTGEALVFE